MRAACLLLMCVAAAGLAQVPMPPPLPTAPNGTTPLLHVRFLGPPGMDVSFYRGPARPSRFPMPVTVGLRAGYIYRVELGGLPDRPGVNLYPSLEVIGTLCLPSRVRGQQFPAPLVVNAEDIEQVLSGAMITKVVYLEYPDVAAAGTGNPDVPVETPVPASGDLIREAWDKGRPLLVFRLGQRELSPETMARQAIPGTILLPGETHLSAPRQPPVVAPITWHWYDPLLGKRKPEGETICNGWINPNRNAGAAAQADQAVRPGFGSDGQLHGLRAQDTVAEYTDSAGRRGLTISNKVCLVAPRFALLRNELPLDHIDGLTGVTDQRSVKGQALLRGGQPLAQAKADQVIVGFQGRERPSGAIGRQGPGNIIRFDMLQPDTSITATAALLGTAGLVKLTDSQRVKLNKQMAFARSFSQREAPGWS